MDKFSLSFAESIIGIFKSNFWGFILTISLYSIKKYRFHPFEKTLLISKNKKANRGAALVQAVMPSFTILTEVSKAALFALII